MPLADWSVPFEVTSPFGNFKLNQVVAGLGYFGCRIDACKLACGVRATTSNVPQADGSILHHRFLTGSQMLLTVQLWEDQGLSRPACDELKQDMLDEFILHFRALLNAGDNEGRISWTPSGQAPRMLDDVRLLQYPAEAIFANTGLELSCVIDCERGYAQDLEQTETAVADGATVTLDNTGTAQYNPVFLVDGPTTAFTISNLTTGIDFEWNEGLPGAVPIGSSHYVELNTFKNTAFLDGNDANESAGIVQLQSDYWELIPGENDVKIVGADMNVLWQPAWG